MEVRGKALNEIKNKSKRSSKKWSLPERLNTRFPLSYFAPNLYREDLSKFFKACGGSAEKYYKYTLSLYLTNVFGQSPISEANREFYEKNMLPNIEAMRRRFGYTPLIVSPPINESRRFDFITPRTDYKKEFNSLIVNSLEIPSELRRGLNLE